MLAEPDVRMETAVEAGGATPGKDEMNFAEFPIALLTDRAPKGQTVIKFEDHVYDERKKKLIPRKRLIEGSQEYGLPTATDDRVILALIQLTKQKNDFTRRDIEFSRLELIRMLGWPNEGKNYDRIKLSLLRIKGVNYTYDNAWWDPRQKTWTTRAFNILDNVEINDSRASDGQGGLFPSRITWNEIVFDSFKAGFVRDIDFQLCMRLEHPTALRMYRFLGKRFYHRQDWTFDLKEFAYIHMNLGRNYEGGTQIARKLQPAITELEGIGFLEPLTESERFPKKGREWGVRFIKKGRLPVLPAPSPAAAAPAESATSSLADELISRGVAKSTAAELVQQHPAETIQAKIEQFDWLMEKQDKRAAKNPPGFLRSSIEKDYAVPRGFVPKAERERLKSEQEAKDRQAEEDRRRRQREELARKAEQKAADDYWAMLTPEQQSQLDDAALAEGGDEARQTYETMKQLGSGGNGYLAMLRRDYIINQLRSQGELASPQA